MAYNETFRGLSNILLTATSRFYKPLFFWKMVAKNYYQGRKMSFIRCRKSALLNQTSLGTTPMNPLKMGIADAEYIQKRNVSLPHRNFYSVLLLLLWRCIASHWKCYAFFLFSDACFFSNAKECYYSLSATLDPFAFLLRYV